MENVVSHDQITVFGDTDQRILDQMTRCLAMEEGSIGVLCADNQVGYGHPVGGAIGYRDHISLSGVGFDIGCGNKAVKTDLLLSELDSEDLPALADEIADKISFGVGRANDEPVDHPVFERIAEAEFPPQRSLLDLARKQLGTVGGGNHYVDLFVDAEGYVWVGVHFGSRGFGHKTCTGFLALNQNKKFGAKASDGPMDGPPVVFDIESGLGQSYIQAMRLAGEYAYAGRDVVVEKVLGILGAEATYSVHNHHNFAWREQHDVGQGPEWFWVVRKGCTPAFPGQAGFVGSTMLEGSVILEGTEANASSLYSTVHGAGRQMSRTQAAGKTRWRWSCCNRDCDWFQPPHTHKPEDGNCPRCGHTTLKKRPQRISEGEIDWEAALEDMAEQGIELRGGDAEEAAGAYKRLDEVLDAHGDTIAVKQNLRPIAVVMAPADVADPYKD